MCRLRGDVAAQTEIGGNCRRDGKRRREKMLLSEMFGVEWDTDFGVEGYYGKFRVRGESGGGEHISVEAESGLYHPVVNSSILYGIIAGAPGNIIHLPPPLTDEQREQLRAIWTLGYRWLVKDKYGSVYTYETKPYKKVRDTWIHDDGDLYLCRTKSTKCLESLVSWSDTEPYDIAKALGV